MLHLIRVGVEYFLTVCYLSVRFSPELVIYGKVIMGRDSLSHCCVVLLSTSQKWTTGGGLPFRCYLLLRLWPNASWKCGMRVRFFVQPAHTDFFCCLISPEKPPQVARTFSCFGLEMLTDVPRLGGAASLARELQLRTSILPCLLPTFWTSRTWEALTHVIVILTYRCMS